MAVACTTISCKESDEIKTGDSEPFKKETSNYGVYSGAQSIIELETNKSQIVYNDQYSSITIQSNDQSKFVYAYLGKHTNYRDAGDKFSINIRSKGLAQLPTYKTTEVKVLKKEGNKMWLWSAELAIGLIVKING